MMDAATRTAYADAYQEAIANALRDRNMNAVVGLLCLLAQVDPERAEAILNTIELGLALTEQERVQ